MTRYHGDLLDIFYVLTQHLSSIFEACQNACANKCKAECGQPVSEADWRYDFDCLLIKFFKYARIGDVTVDPGSSASCNSVMTNAPRSCPNGEHACACGSALALPSYVSFVYDVSNPDDIAAWKRQSFFPSPTHLK